MPAEKHSYWRKVALVVSVSVTVGLLLYLLRGMLAPVLLAFLLAYLFDPLADWLERHSWPRPLAVSLCLLVLVVLTVGVIALVIPTIYHEIGALARKAPQYVARVQSALVPWIEKNLGWQLSGQSLGEVLSSTANKLSASAEQLAGPLARIVQQLLSSIAGLLSALIVLVLIPLFTYFFLVDYDRIVNWFVELVPPARRPLFLERAREIDEVFSGFLRGQGTVCAILAVIYSVALTLAGVPAGVTIGVITGLFNFVPYVGTTTGILLSCLFLLLEGSSWSAFLVVGIIFAAVNLVDGLFITPRVLGKRLGLAPVAVILALMAFGEIFGFVGVLMAVPVTAIGKVLGKHALAAYRQSRLYNAADGEGGHGDG